MTGLLFHKMSGVRLLGAAMIVGMLAWAASVSAESVDVEGATTASLNLIVTGDSAPTLGAVQFWAEDSITSLTEYARISGLVENAEDESETGELGLYVMANGALQKIAVVSSAGLRIDAGDIQVATSGSLIIGAGGDSYRLPESDGNADQVLRTDGNGNVSWQDGDGLGDVTGPGSSTANAVALYNGTTGKMLKNSGVTYDGSMLDVPGKVEADQLGVSGAYTLPASDGLPNYVLKTDGNGNVSWQPDGGSGGGGWTELDRVTLDSSSTSVTFSSIPNDYDDLVVLCYARSTYAADYGCAYIRVGNGTLDGSSYYPYVHERVGTSDYDLPYSGNALWFVDRAIPGNNADAGEFGYFTVKIYDYADTSRYRCAEWNGGYAATGNDGQLSRGVGYWPNNTDEIDIVRLYAQNGSFASGSEFILYGSLREASDTGTVVVVGETTGTLQIYTNDVGTTLGSISLMAENSITSMTEYARISGAIEDSTDGSEDSKLDLFVMSDGTLTNIASVTTSGLRLGSGATSFVLPNTDGAANQVLKTDGSGQVSWQTETTGAVESVFGRTGAVTAQQDDYDAGLIEFAPEGNLSSLNVQEAMEELDDEKQPLDSTLSSLATYNTNGMVAQTAADTFAGRTITGDSEIVVTDGDGVSGNPTLSIASTITRDSELTDFTSYSSGYADHAIIRFDGAGTSVQGGTSAPTYDDSGNVTFNAEVNGSCETIVFTHNSSFTPAYNDIEEMYLGDVQTIYDDKGFVALKSGSIIGISCNYDTTTASDDNYLYVYAGSGYAGGLQLTTSVADNKTAYTTFSRGTYTFSAGDIIMCGVGYVSGQGSANDEVIIGIRIMYD